MALHCSISSFETPQRILSVCILWVTLECLTMKMKTLHMLREIFNYTTSNTASHPRRLEMSVMLFYKPHISHCDLFYVSNRISTDATDICSENGDPPTSPSSLSSSKTIVYDAGIEANYSPEALQKTLTNATNTNKQRPMSAPERKNSGNTRPNSPPPLPPNSSGSSGKFEREGRSCKHVRFEAVTVHTCTRTSHVVSHISADLKISVFGNCLIPVMRSNVDFAEGDVLDGWKFVF